MKIKIGTKEFNSKAAAKREIGALKSKCRHGDIICNDDFLFISDVLKRHPYFEQKEGVGIESISVKRNEWGKTGFYINRIDGSGTDFSYIFCIDNKVDYRKDFIAAARQEIKEQIISWKSKNFFGKCENCGCNVDYDNCDIDHAPVRFDTIINSYISEYNIHENFKGLTELENWDGVEGKKITDEDVAKSWRDYHSNIAKYRVTCVSCNRGRK